ncbi:MAG: hypothetical protein JWN78_2666 [Bacteroidota bacterium]|nr:hypothetical protein [Bacteroidota bacterium]
MKSNNHNQPYKVHADVNKPLGKSEQTQDANGRTPMVQRMKDEWKNNRKGVLQTAAVVTAVVAAVGVTVYLLRKKSMISMIRNSGLVTAGLAMAEKVMDTAEAVTHRVAERASAVTHNLMETAGVVSHQVADTACDVTGKLKAEVVS